jgi:hypothetical protein
VCSSDLAIVTVTGSTISGNTAVTDGGGIHADSYRGNSVVTVTDSTISDNTAGEGGGVFAFS